jgi:serine/threonine-protein phosphatase 6 regulatory ankyrin repeat subunit B
MSKAQKPGPGAFINAVRFSNIETMKDMLARGADVNEKDNVHNTALMYAAGRRHYTQVVRLLLDNGASIDEKNNNGNTALINAVSMENAEIVRLLIDNNASLGIRNGRGYTAQDIAEVKGFSQIARMLKEAAEARRKVDEEKARLEALHALAAERQRQLQKKLPKLKPKAL